MNLSVNLNKIALLRNSRGGARPSPLAAAALVLDAGADGLTLHWREDERHTHKEDVYQLRELAAARGREFNLEGDLREELIALAIELKVDQATLVPVTPGEITSDHGWSFPQDAERLRPVIARLKDAGLRVSLFIDPVPGTATGAAEAGADRVEIYTEPWAAAFGTAGADRELAAIVATVAEARAAGLGVNAGHDLDLYNLPPLARAAVIDEVSIGHALISDALTIGLEETIRSYLLAAQGIDLLHEPTQI